MRKLLILLLACAAVFGTTANLEEAVRTYLEPGIVVDTVTQIPTANGSAYLIPIDGQETLLIGDWSPVAISDEAQIAAILKQSVLVRANLTGAKNQTAALVDEISTLKAEPEKSCALYTGTTSLPCTDKNSCNTAAQSSPQASVMIQAEGFWQDMASWYGAKTRLNTALVELRGLATGSGEDMAYANSVAAKIAQANNITGELDANNLLRKGVYGIGTYCPQIAWPTTKLLLAQNRWTGIATTLGEMQTIDGRAHTLAAKTEAWLNYVNTRNDDFQKMKNNLNGINYKIDMKAKEANATISENSQINGEIASFKNATLSAINDGNAGKFRVALLQEDTLAARGNGILGKIDAQLALVNSTKKHLQNALKAIDKLGQMGENETAGKLAFQAMEINDTLKNRVNASELSKLEAASKEIESDALQAVAAAALNIEQEEEKAAEVKTENKTAQPAAQQQKNETTTPTAPHVQTDNTGTQNGQNAPKPQAASCPLPLAAIGGAVGLAAIRRD